MVTWTWKRQEGRTYEEIGRGMEERGVTRDRDSQISGACGVPSRFWRPGKSRSVNEYKRGG